MTMQHPFTRNLTDGKTTRIYDVSNWTIAEQTKP
jgi:hypothetical protein